MTAGTGPATAIAGLAVFPLHANEEGGMVARLAAATRPIAFERLGTMKQALLKAGYTPRIHDASVDELSPSELNGADLLIAKVEQTGRRPAPDGRTE